MSERLGLFGGGLMLMGALLVGVGTLVGGGAGSFNMTGPNFGGGFGGMMGDDRVGMMGGAGMGGYWRGSTADPGPGEAGFVAGTTARPRIVRVVAGPGYTFRPSAIAVARGETVTFEVTSMGGLVHEFMVGPEDAVATDEEGTPEVADIGMMQTKSVTYTFDGAGPYAFACHAPGHYEAGMRGTITVAH
jgi:plastocyanin